MSRCDRRETVRHEQELEVGRQLAPLGNVHVEKRVETDRVAREVPRTVEHGAVERVPAAREDSGEIETLPDGSVSIPVLAEELVITKRVLVRERIVVRKEAVDEVERIDVDLSHEVVDVAVHDERGEQG